MSSHASGRRSTSYYVSYPTLPSLTETLPEPESIVINENQFSHDVAVLSFPVLNQAALSLFKTGVPVKLRWTKENLTRDWVGYVSFISSEHSVNPKKRMEVHCIGASFPLKNRKPRVFKSKTIPQVVEILAKEAGLQFSGDSNPRIFDQVSISGTSCWEWICANAKKIGFGVVVDGTTLYFKKVDSLIDIYSSNSAIISYFANDFPTDFLAVDRTLDYFKVMNGEYVEGDALRNEKHIGGVNPVTGKTVSTKQKPNQVGKNTRSSTSDVFFEDQRVHDVVHDSTAAMVAANGAAHMSRFTIPARVKCQGDTRIRPFAPVLVDGVSGELDGRWLVVSVKHYMNINNEYQIEMHVAADGNGKDVNGPTRTTQSSEIGTIDIAAALNNGGIPVSVSAAKTTVLKYGGLKPKTSRPLKASHKQENNQGFNRTPAKWVVSASRKGKK